MYTSLQVFVRSKGQRGTNTVIVPAERVGGFGWFWLVGSWFVVLVGKSNAFLIDAAEFYRGQGEASLKATIEY